MNATASHIELDDRIAPVSLPDERAVEGWFRVLRSRGIGFHPEETFAEIVDLKSGSPMFRRQDAERLDALMQQANSVCEPCSVALRVVMPDAVAADDAPTVRVSEQGSRFEIATIRDFLKGTLAEDAVADQVTELLFDHVVKGRLHHSVVATTLPAYIQEILQTATVADWQAVADELIADARELLAEEAAT